MINEQPMRSEITKSRFVSHWRVYLFILLLSGVTILAYRPAWHGGFLWDDDAYVTNNDLLTAPDGLRRIWFSFDSPSQYFPLVYTMFRVERALWGLNPAGYHVVNLILHVANALLVWRLLVRLNVPGAWLAGAIFALHPVQVESVAWITERKNVLMVFFFLLALLTWIEFVDKQTRRRWHLYALALILYALALFSKTTACTLPAALLLILWLKKKPIDRQRLIQIIPFIILGVGMGLLTVWWERYHQGTRGALFALGPVERILIASRAIWFYLGKLLWPSNLTFIYPRWTVAPTNLLDYTWLLAAGGLSATVYFARRYVGRSIEVATVFFVATLTPVLGFIMLYTFRYTFVADHYQYLASIGPIALFSAGVTNLTATYKESRHFILLMASCLVVTLAALTWRQSAVYADIESLWRTTIAKNPDCWMAHNNLGIVLLQKGEIDEAIAHYQRTLQMRPDFAEADYNLGNALLQKGEIDEAIIHCRKAVAAQPRDPEAQLGLGNALLKKGLIQEATSCYERALSIRPYYFDAHRNLSSALRKQGELDAALLHARLAVSIQSENADGHIELAIVLAQKGQIADAIAQYEQALAISPGSVVACNNVAWLWATSADASRRNGRKAIELAREANYLSGGDNPVVLHTLAAAYAEGGQFEEAVATAEKASHVAMVKGDRALAAALEQEIRAYRSGYTYLESSK